MNKLKKDASDWCSKYIRLRDALEYCKRMRIDVSELARVEDIPVQCCTCSTVKSWINMQAGHYFSRGLGGGSGVYFDERNINTQCPPCNGFKEGNKQAYREFMLKKFGQKIIDELEIKHLGGSKRSHIQLKALSEFYKGCYNGLVNSLIIS